MDIRFLYDGEERKTNKKGKISIQLFEVKSGL